VLAPKLPDNFREMEPLFLAVICGCNAGFFRTALHEVYIPRIQRGDTAFAANVLGAREALLSIIVHFFENGNWGSPVTTSVERQSLSPEDQLFILMQGGLYLTVTRGQGMPEARICYERAERLCHLLNRPVLLHVALIGQWRYSLITGNLSAAQCAARRRLGWSRRSCGRPGTLRLEPAGAGGVEAHRLLPTREPQRSGFGSWVIDRKRHSLTGLTNAAWRFC
jgi:hypothetical protein